MCGVSGFFGKKKINFDVIKKTLYLMKKRGPDSQNYFHRKTNNLNIYLLHSRLEIIDPKSRSNQPFKFKTDCVGIPNKLVQVLRDPRANQHNVWLATLLKPNAGKSELLAY